MPVFLGNVQFAAGKLGTYVAEAPNFLVGRLSSTLVAATIFQAEESKVIWLGANLNFRSENAICFGKVSTSGWKINIGVRQTPTFCLEGVVLN